MELAEFEERIALTREGETVRGFIFNSILKYLEREAGPEIVEGVRSSLKRPKFTDFFSYSSADFLRLLHHGAAAIAPKVGGVNSALNQFGRANVDSFFESTVGKTLLVIVGKQDALRLLNNVNNAYSTVVNYGSRSFERVGERKGVLHFRDSSPPAYHVGVLTAALRWVGVEARITPTMKSLEECDYLVEW